MTSQARGESESSMLTGLSQALKPYQTLFCVLVYAFTSLVIGSTIQYYIDDPPGIWINSSQVTLDARQCDPGNNYSIVEQAIETNLITNIVLNCLVGLLPFIPVGIFLRMIFHNTVLCKSILHKIVFIQFFKPNVASFLSPIPCSNLEDFSNNHRLIINKIVLLFISHILAQTTNFSVAKLISLFLEAPNNMFWPLCLSDTSPSKCQDLLSLSSFFNSSVKINKELLVAETLQEACSLSRASLNTLYINLHSRIENLTSNIGASFFATLLCLSYIFQLEQLNQDRLKRKTFLVKCFICVGFVFITGLILVQKYFTLTQTFFDLCSNACIGLVIQVAIYYSLRCVFSESLKFSVQGEQPINLWPLKDGLCSKENQNSQQKSEVRKPR